MDPWPNWIRREATDFEIIGSTPIGFTKKTRMVMKSLKKIFSMINLSVVGLAMLFLIIGSTALHIYTIYVGFKFAGFWPALITFFVVGVSEIFWGYIFWQATGVFLNTYNIILLGYVVLSFVSIIIVANYSAQKNVLSIIVCKIIRFLSRKII